MGLHCGSVSLRVHANVDESPKISCARGAKTVGMLVFEYIATAHDYSEVFNRAMTTLGAAVTPASIEAYDLSDVGVLVDVAGGPRSAGVDSCRSSRHARHPDGRRPCSRPAPRLGSPRQGLADGVQAIAGDLFTAVPPDGDAYLMKHIIHDWDNERAVVILRNIHSTRRQAPRRTGPESKLVALSPARALPRPRPHRPHRPVCVIEARRRQGARLWPVALRRTSTRA